VDQASSSRLRVATEYAYLLALAFLPWRWFPPFPWLHVHAQWSDALVALAAAFWFIALWRERRPPVIVPAHIAMGFYLAWAALSYAAHAGDKAVNPWKLVGMAELVVLGTMTTDLASRRILRVRLHRVVMISALVAAAGAIGGVVLHVMGLATPLVGGYGDLIPGAYARARAGFDHPNLLASYCLFSWSMARHPDSDPRRWLRRIALGAIMIALVLTFSRALIAFPLLLLVRRPATPAQKRWAGAYFIAAAIGLVFLTFVNLTLDPTRIWEATLDAQVSTRRQALATAVQTLVDQPVFGSGPGTSPGQVGNAPFDAHCTPLNVAATLGIPAFIAFLSIWILLWLRRPRPTDGVIWGALTAMALDGLTQDIEDYRHLWVLLGLAATRDELQTNPPLPGRRGECPKYRGRFNAFGRATRPA
jgi:hypothetical protein